MATRYVTCPNCGSQNLGTNVRCTTCGSGLPAGPMQPYPTQAKAPGGDKKLAAGLCGILLGGFGVHKFILGYQQEGIIMLAAYLIGLVLTVVTCGIAFPLPLAVNVVGIIEGIMYLTKSDEEFVQTYIVGKKPWF